MENACSTQTIKEALKQEPLTTGRGLMQRLFAFWFDGFVYNQIWEDPRVDIEALQIESDSSILTISSGGCNALNYLLENPGKVTAVDLNRNHIYLLNLKKAAVESLPGHKEFFDFFGFGTVQHAVKLYFEYLSGSLSSETRRYWEAKTLSGHVTGKTRLAYFQGRGLYDQSRNGFFLRVFHRLAVLHGFRPAAVLDAESFEEQTVLYEKFTDPFFETLLVRAVCRLPITMFGLGIPPQQFEELQKELGEKGTIVDVYRDRVRRLATAYPIDENYFAWQAFSRSYDTRNRKAVPEYLKEENFAILKSNISKLSTRIGSVTSEIAGNPSGTFDRYVFLDAQDWMDAAAVNKLWSLIAEKSEPGTRIIFRTAGSASPVEKCLSSDIRSRFVYHESESKDFFKKDRASIYGGFHLYVLR